MQNLPNEFSMQELMRLAQSPAGKQLIQLLKSKDPGQLQEVITQAQNGNYEQAKNGISSLLGSEDIQKVLDEHRGMGRG